MSSRNRAAIFATLSVASLLGFQALSEHRAQEASARLTHQVEALAAQLRATSERMERVAPEPYRPRAAQVVAADSYEKIAARVADKPEGPQPDTHAMRPRQDEADAPDLEVLANATRVLDDAMESGLWTRDQERDLVQLLGAARSDEAAQQMMQRVSMAINRGELVPEAPM
jgi:hypothetical protein